MMSISAPRYVDWQAILEQFWSGSGARWGLEGSDMMNRPMRRYSGGPMGAPMMANPYANPYINPQNQASLSPRQIVERLDLDRRQRLLRPITLGTFILAVLLVPAVIFPTPDMGGLSAVIVALIGSGLAYLLCRLRMTDASSYFLLGGVTIAAAINIVGRAYAQNGLDSIDLRQYDFFVLPILLSAVLASRRAPIIIAVCTCTFTIISLILLPHQPSLQSYWDGTYAIEVGSAYDVIIVPVALQILTAVMAWLGINSVRRALMGAARADELAQLNERIISQTREIEFQRRRLADGVSHIQQVNAAFARGNFDARVRVDDGEPLPLAMSLNALFDRLQRLSRDQEQHARMAMGSNQLAAALRRARSGGPFVPPDYTGTPLDQALVELAAMRHALDAAGVAPQIGSSPSNTAAVYGRGSGQGGGQGSSQGGFSQGSGPSNFNYQPNSGFDQQGGAASDLNGRQAEPTRADESGELPFWLRPDNE